MASDDDETRDKAMQPLRHGSRPSSTPRGGYAAESEAASIAVAASTCPSGCWASRSRRSPAVSAAASSWRASCSPARRPCCSTSRPTTSTPTRSSGCATTSRRYKGGLIVISHDVELLDDRRQPGVPPRRQPGRDRRLQRRLEDLPAAARDRRAPPQARARQRREEGRHADGAGRQDARQGHQGGRRRRTWPSAPSGCSPGSRPSGSGQGRQAALPRARPVRQDAADGARSCRSRTARWRSSPTSTWRSTAAAGSSSSASTAPARPRCCGSSAGVDAPDTGEVVPGHGLKLGYYAQEHETLDVTGRSWRTCSPPRRTSATPRSRKVLGLVPVLRRRRRQAGRRALRRREDPAGPRHPGGVRGQRAAARRADQQPRPGQPRGDPRRADAPTRAPSCWSRHDEGAVAALEPERVLLLPDGVEDHLVPTTSTSSPWPDAGGRPDARAASRAAPGAGRPAADADPGRPRPGATPRRRACGRRWPRSGSRWPRRSAWSRARRGPSFTAGLHRAAHAAGRAGEPSVLELAASGEEALGPRSPASSAASPWSQVPAVVLAAVQGAAIGAGFQLALACDLRVVADDVAFAMRETSLGLVPDLAGTAPLVRLVGYARALEICATGRAVHADEAVRLGLAQVAVPRASWTTRPATWPARSWRRPPRRCAS